MSHTYAHNPVHIVFSTKDRRKLIPTNTKPRLWAYMAGVCKKHKVFVHEIGGMEDHAHLLIEIPLTLAHSDAIDEIKPIPRAGWAANSPGSVVSAPSA